VVEIPELDEKVKRDKCVGDPKKIEKYPPELLNKQFSPNLFHVMYLHNKAGSCYTALIIKFLTWVILFTYQKT
jgi:hypothetical protein